MSTPTAEPVEAEEYLARIGWAEGDRPAPGRDTLVRLQEAHLTAVPFENLDIHLGRPIALDEGSILHKLVRERRGGFCYELNSAFAWLLRTLGFGVELLEARVALDSQRYGAPFDHLVLRVDVEGEPWQADVGFGDHAVRPFPMADGVEHREGGRSWRWVARRPGFLDLDLRRPDADWFPDHRLSLLAHRLDAFGPRCAWQQRAPDSNFTAGPVCTRLLTGGGRVTLADDLLITTAADGTRTYHELRTDGEVLAAYRDRFGLVLPRRPDRAGKRAAPSAGAG
ncbi:MAG: arylamine N-acetyltransferase [Actinobacteria bacterium]|nr:arylamine N-acetyltransferase [Actinomycetota bacterium]